MDSNPEWRSVQVNPHKFGSVPLIEVVPLGIETEVQLTLGPDRLVNSSLPHSSLKSTKHEASRMRCALCACIILFHGRSADNWTIIDHLTALQRLLTVLYFRHWLFDMSLNALCVTSVNALANLLEAISCRQCSTDRQTDRETQWHYFTCCACAHRAIEHCNTV